MSYPLSVKKPFLLPTECRRMAVQFDVQRLIATNHLREISFDIHMEGPTAPAINFPRISVDSNRVDCLVEKGDLATEVHR